MSPFKSLMLLSLFALPSVGEAATYYVSTTGSAANSCVAAQNPATAKNSIRAAMQCVGVGPNVGGGHTVVVMPGTYDEEIRGSDLPGGSSPASPFTLKAQTRGTVTLRPTKGPCTDPNTGKSGVPCFNIEPYEAYIVIDGFVLDGSFVSHDGVRFWNDYLVVQYTEIFNPQASCILGSGNYGKFLKLELHACGLRDSSYHPGQGGHNDIYLGGNHNEVAYTHLYNGSAGMGFWNDVMVPSYNVAHHNLIERGFLTGGIGMYRGPGNKAYNNVIVDGGIEVGWGCSDCAVLNNTIYNTQGTGNYGYGIHVDATVKNTLVQNNIIWRAQEGPIFNESSTTTQSNNLTSDPMFIDPKAKNFQLMAASPAVDAGISLATQGVKDDFIGTTRPQKGSYDIGAYEFTGGSGDTEPPARPQGVRVQ